MPYSFAILFKNKVETLDNPCLKREGAPPIHISLYKYKEGKKFLILIVRQSVFILTKSNMLLSFSKLTFPHGLFRGILLEQIYRSFKILNNETYHK